MTLACCPIRSPQAKPEGRSFAPSEGNGALIKYQLS
jgi:hypothetical protein